MKKQYQGVESGQLVQMLLTCQPKWELRIDHRISNREFIDYLDRVSINWAVQERPEWNEIKSSWRGGTGNSEYKELFQSVLLPKAEEKKMDGSWEGKWDQ